MQILQLVCQIFGELACVFLRFIFLKISDLSVQKLEKFNIFLIFLIFGINLYFCIIELEFSNKIPLLTNHMKKDFTKQLPATSGLPDMAHQPGSLGNRAQKVAFYAPGAA